MATVQAWAPPVAWGPWVDLLGHAGLAPYTVKFESASQAPSSFDVQIQYATSTQMKLVSTVGPGSYRIADNNGAGTDRARFKSHSIGQDIRVTF